MDGAISSAIVDILTIFDAEAQNEERNNFYYIVKESEKVHKFIFIAILCVLCIIPSVSEILRDLLKRID